jgi:hypothetical protein
MSNEEKETIVLTPIIIKQTNSKGEESVLDLGDGFFRHIYSVEELPKSELKQRWRIGHILWEDINKKEKEKEDRDLEPRETYIFPTIKVWKIGLHIQFDFIWIRRRLIIELHKPEMVKQRRIRRFLLRLKLRLKDLWTKKTFI